MKNIVVLLYFIYHQQAKMLFNLIGISATHFKISSLHIRKSYLKIFFLSIWEILFMYSLINTNKGKFSTFFPEKEVQFQHKNRYGLSAAGTRNYKAGQIECLLMYFWGLCTLRAEALRSS